MGRPAGENTLAYSGPFECHEEKKVFLTSGPSSLAQKSMPLKIVVPSLGLRFTKLLTNFFCIDVTFEMRTVLSVIRLFNDNLKNCQTAFLYQTEMEGKRAG